MTAPVTPAELHAIRTLVDEIAVLRQQLDSYEREIIRQRAELDRLRPQPAIVPVTVESIEHCPAIMTANGVREYLACGGSFYRWNGGWRFLRNGQVITVTVTSTIAALERRDAEQVAA